MNNEDIEPKIVEGQLEREPHISGTRITVQRVGALNEKRSLQPETIADRLEIGLDAVTAALSYYYEHFERMRNIQDKRKAAAESVQLENPDPADVADGTAFPESPSSELWADIIKSNKNE